MRQTAVSFYAADLKLEGVVGCPDDRPGPFPGVVLCHPHPLRGGNMNNNLVLSVYHALVDAGFAALRFNFRGVGNSQGTHTEGERETHDAEAALQTLKDTDRVDPARLGMAGYSFGTGVILRNPSGYSEARSCVLFSSPVRFLEHPEIDDDPRPKLFVCGDQDESVPIEPLKERLKSMVGPVEWQVAEGVDHFWWGREAEAAGHAVEFFARTLGQPSIREET